MSHHDSLEQRWSVRIQELAHIHGKELSMEGLLLLVGLQQLDVWKSSYTKEEKKELIHVGTCVVLAQSGYYEKTHVDEQGWPHFVLKKKLPTMKLSEQENFLKDHLLLFLNGY